MSTRILHPVSPGCRGSKEGVRVGLMYSLRVFWGGQVGVNFVCVKCFGKNNGGGK